MKIIISPAKTLKEVNSTLLNDKELLFPKEHKKVLAALKKLSKTDIKRIMKIDKTLLDTTYQNIKNYKENDTLKAFFSYDGLVFKGLDKDHYKELEYQYIENHLRILDGFYGIIEPGTLIKPYRLDMKMKIGLNLYNHFPIDDYFKNEIIINLASDEYSKMIKKNMITISFLQKKEEKYVNQATYSKQARGIFLDFLIKSNITDLNLLKTFKKQNYQYNETLSTESNYVFTR